MTNTEIELFDKIEKLEEQITELSKLAVFQHKTLLEFIDVLRYNIKQFILDKHSEYSKFSKLYEKFSFIFSSLKN